MICVLNTLSARRTPRFPWMNWHTKQEVLDTSASSVTHHINSPGKINNLPMTISL